MKTSQDSPNARTPCSMPFGQCSRGVAQCCTQPARCSRRRTVRALPRCAIAIPTRRGCLCMAAWTYNCCRMPSMTAFITRCYASALEGLRLIMVVALLGVSTFVQADASVRSAALIATQDGYMLNADFDLGLNPRLIDALQRGVSLYFSVEFNV